MSKKSVVIIGAGITGLPIALEFCKKGHQVTVLERNSFVGGVATSLRTNGYIMDIGPHYVTLPRESDVTKEIFDILGTKNIKKLSDNIRRDRKAYFEGKFWNEFPSIPTFLKESGISPIINFGIDYCITKIRKAIGFYDEPTPKNYLISNYSQFLYKRWFLPYFANLYYDSIPPLESVKQQFPPLTLKKLFSFFRKSNKIDKNTTTKNKEYLNYYFKGGMISLIEGLQKKIESLGGTIITNAQIESISHEQIKQIIFKTNNLETCLTADIIVYALPLNIAMQWFDKTIQLNKSNLLNSIMLFLFLDMQTVYKNWIIDFYDKDVIFWRIAQPTYLSNTVAPNNKSLLSIEIRSSENDNLWALTNEQIFDLVCKDLKKIDLFDIEKIENHKIIKLKNLYTLDPTSINSTQSKKLIESFSGEYAAGTETDAGVLIGDDNDSIPRLGGVFRAMASAKLLSNRILEQN